MKIAPTLLILLLAVAAATAQNAPRGVCGTHDVDIARTKANIAAAKAYAKTRPSAAARTEVTYVPVRFKLVGDSDGTREATATNVMNLIEAVNRDFAPYNWRFFAHDVDGLPFDYFFDDARNDGLRDDDADDAFVNGNRSRDAITVYVVTNASTGRNSIGVTLGFYSTGQDIIVLRTTEVSSNAATATHELGHYFSLPHTFRGWDLESWDGDVCSDTAYSSPVTELRAPNTIGGQRPLVELVTRGDDANCAEAGDLFCDTGADYNLGFGFGGCDYRGPVVDRNGDRLRPNENNFMSYFNDCASYEFSVGQFDAVQADLRTNRRGFLRRGLTPINTDSVRARAAFTAPAQDEVIGAADVATITWDPVEHATYYFAEFGTSRTFAEPGTIRQVVLPADQLSLTVDGLEADTRYYARVRGFNQLTVGLPSPRLQFNTGTVSSVARPDAVTGLTVAPNPVAAGGTLAAAFGVESGGDYRLDVLDAVGRLVGTQSARLHAGSARVDVPAAGELGAGAYVLRVSGERGVTTRRFVVR